MQKSPGEIKQEIKDAALANDLIAQAIRHGLTQKLSEYRELSGKTRAELNKDPVWKRLEEKLGEAMRDEAHSSMLFMAVNDPLTQ